MNLDMALDAPDGLAGGRRPCDEAAADFFGKRDRADDRDLIDNACAKAAPAP